MDITGYVLWALLIGVLAGTVITFTVVEINIFREEKRIEKKYRYRNYYDFCAWINDRNNRYNKPIDFRVTDGSVSSTGDAQDDVIHR